MSSVNLLRQIVREIRQSYNGQLPLSRLPIVNYIVKEFRNNSMTDAQKCARENEAKQLAETYLNYLKNLKKHSELVERYKSHERSTEEAAKMVGLSLPEKPNHLV